MTLQWYLTFVIHEKSGPIPGKMVRNSSTAVHRVVLALRLEVFWLKKVINGATGGTKMVGESLNGPLKKVGLFLGLNRDYNGKMLHHQKWRCFPKPQQWGAVLGILFLQGWWDIFSFWSANNSSYTTGSHTQKAYTHTNTSSPQILLVSAHAWMHFT